MPEITKQGIKRLHLVKASEVEIEEVSWLWYPYIPSGKLVMLEGDPGLGKSWISCAIAADVSAGRALPGQKALPPQKVLMLSAEDGLGDTVVPRLTALEANKENVILSDSAFILDALGIREIEGLMRSTAATIVFIDPIVAYLGKGIDMNKANEVRDVLGPLAAAAKRTGTAVVAVRHLRKSGGNNAKYRGLGSIDFTAAVRSVVQVGETKQGTTYMEHVKHNLSPKGDTLAYEIEDGRFEWRGTFFGSAKGAGRKISTVTKDQREQLELLIFDLLRDGALPSVDVQNAVEAKGFKPRTFQTVRKDMGIISEKRSSGWYMSLPEKGDPQ